MTKYKKKQVGHFVNMFFSFGAILFCVFLAKIMMSTEDGSGSAFFVILASGLIVLLIGNITFSIKKLRYLSSIRYKFVSEE